ncbi:MAG: hypothetical protein AAFQ37_14590, partial [Bacteroidota bacterium]
IFFTVFLLLGLAITPDYGISTDETVQLRHSQVSIDYAAQKLGLDWEPFLPTYDLETYGSRAYSMLYGMICTGVAEGVGVERTNFRGQYLVRHYTAFLLFWLAVVAFYGTAKMRFGCWEYSMLATLFLVLNPRVFANAFYNPKDTIVLDFYVYATFTLFLFLRKRNWWTLLLHALATGALLNTRLPAMILPLMTILLLAVEVIQKRRYWQKNLLQVGAYLSVSFLVFVVLFPYLWEDTFTRIVEIYQRMAKFEWDSHNLIFGEFILGTETPAWYIPAWIMVTLPLSILTLVLIGIVVVGARSIQYLLRGRFWTNLEEQFDLTQLGLALGPILAVIVLGSNLYNGWRHLYFVYPGFAFLAVMTWDKLWQLKGTRWQSIMATLLAVNLGMVLLFMIQFHPH